MHTIRLRGFWETSTEGSRTIHSRPFGRPRLLDAAERVWLLCAWVPGSAEVAINGEPVGVAPEAGPFAADITDQLQKRNTAQLAVESGEQLGEVVLEIRAAIN